MFELEKKTTTIKLPKFDVLTMNERKPNVDIKKTKRKLLKQKKNTAWNDKMPMAYHQYKTMGKTKEKTNYDNYSL
jgi:hypothetical protein